MFNWSGLNGKERVQLIGTPVAYCLLMWPNRACACIRKSKRKMSCPSAGGWRNGPSGKPTFPTSPFPITFRPIIYRADSGWREWGEYIPLAELEHQCMNLLRINRSTLINPGKISPIEKSGRQFILRMKGDPDGAFRVSRSKNQLIKKLMQTAAVAGVRADPDS